MQLQSQVYQINKNISRKLKILFTLKDTNKINVSLTYIHCLVIVRSLPGLGFLHSRDVRVA